MLIKKNRLDINMWGNLCGPKYGFIVLFHWTFWDRLLYIISSSIAAWNFMLEGLKRDYGSQEAMPVLEGLNVRLNTYTDLRGHASKSMPQWKLYATRIRGHEESLRIIEWFWGGRLLWRFNLSRFLRVWCAWNTKQPFSIDQSPSCMPSCEAGKKFFHIRQLC